MTGDAALLPGGTRLGDYRITAHIGGGASGDVYAADGPHGPVVVKVIRSSLADRPGVRQRLAREAALARRAQGPGVVRLLDVDTTVAQPYLVMEFVPAPDLARTVQASGPLTGERFDRFAASLLTAVSHIHRSGIVHRDLKPANVLVGTDGTAHVTDFGIALDGIHVDVVGESRGTAGWLAPEVSAGGPPTAASDVYGVGRLVVFAATGRLDAVAADVPEGWRATVAAATATDPAARGSAYVPAVFADRFPVPGAPPVGATDGSAPTEPPSRFARPRRPRLHRSTGPRQWSRPPRVVVAAIVAVAAAAAGVAGVRWVTSGSAPARRLVVFDDEFAPGFSLNPNNGVNDAGSTVAVHSGRVAIRTTPSNYGGFYIDIADGTSLATFRSLRFWIHGGDEGARGFVVVGHRDVATEVGRLPIPDVAPGSWRQVEVDLQDLTGGPSFDVASSRLIGFLTASPAAHAPITVDRIELLAR